MGKIALYIRGITSSKISSFNAIIRNKYIMGKRQPIERSLNENQKKVLSYKLDKLVGWNVEYRQLQNSKTLHELFTKTNEQVQKLFNPDSFFVIRNVGYRLKYIFPQNFHDYHVFLKKNSFADFCQKNNMSLYIPDIENESLFLSDNEHNIFKSTLKECGIKFKKNSVTLYKSILFLPLIFSERVKDPLGSFGLLWKSLNPIDPFVDLEISRELANFAAIPFFNIVATEDLKKV